jgi:uncharacterized DUF497 family protein
MFRWNEEKTLKLIQKLGVSFEETVEVMRDEGVLDHYRHPNTDKYPNQYIFVVRLKGYVHYVPYVREGEDIFLKNIIPSRKLNKKYT